MDSFIGLFNPADSVLEPRKKQKNRKKNNQSQQSVIESGQSSCGSNQTNQSGCSYVNLDQSACFAEEFNQLPVNRRPKKNNQKNAHLPDESSFLCEPDLDNEVLVKSSSYIDSYMRDDVIEKQGRIIKRRSLGRRNRRKRSKVSPICEDQTLNNQTESSCQKNTDLGKNVNNLSDKSNDWKFDTFDTLGSCQNISFKMEASDFDTESGDDSESEWDTSLEICGRLPPEPQLGNVEYKLKLVRPSEQRFQHLVTQLKWRMSSGGGTAVYVVGVDDDGAVRGLSENSLRQSVRTLSYMARAIGASMQVTSRIINTKRYLAEVLIRKMADEQQSVELRVAVMGANEAGKSTLIGVLTQGELDNGRGSARLNMFRHLHEVRSGRTSSLSHEILGFDAQGGVVNYGCSELMTAARIDAKSCKLIAFIDLAGHYKYQNTTVFGLALYRPHYVMLVVSATVGISRMTEEHLSLALVLDLPFFVVITKVELVNTVVIQELVDEIEKLLQKMNCFKKVVVITDEKSAGELLSTDSVGVFAVSCVKGNGLNHLHAALHAATPPQQRIHMKEPCEFQIDEIFRVGDNISPIVGGLQVKGCINDGDEVLIGPLDTGDFIPIKIKSIYRNRVPCSNVKPGQSASLGLSVHPPLLRQGMVLIAVPKNYTPKSYVHNSDCKYFLNRDVIKKNKRKFLKKTKSINYDSDFKKDDSSSDSNKNQTTDYSDVDIATQQDLNLSATTHKNHFKSNVKMSNSQYIDKLNEASDGNDDLKTKNSDSGFVKTENHDFDSICKATSNLDDLGNITAKTKTTAESCAKETHSFDARSKSYDKTIDNINRNNLRVTNSVDGLDKSENHDFYSISKPGTVCKESTKTFDDLKTINSVDGFAKSENHDFDSISKPTKVKFCDEFNLDLVKNISVSDDIPKIQYFKQKKVKNVSDSECEQNDMLFKCNCFEDKLILDDQNDPRGCMYFQASIRVLPNSSSIYPGVQLRVYSGNIRQTSIVEGVMSRNNVICPGESASAILRFYKQPEYIRPDRKVLLRLSRETCAVGTVTQVFPYIDR